MKIMGLLWRIIRKGLTRRLGRTIFSILSVVIGVMLLTGISLATSSWKYSEQFSYQEANMADFVVYTQPLSQNIINTIADLSNVKAVEGRIFFPTTINYPPNYTDIEVWLFGVDVPLDLDRVQIIKGSFFSSNGEESLVAEHNYFNAITGLEPVGKEIEITDPLGNHVFPIAGTFRSMWTPSYGTAGAPPILLVPIETAQEIFGIEGKINSLVVQITDKYEVSATIERVKESLGDDVILSVTCEGKILAPFTFEPYLIGLTNSLRIVGILTLLVGGALIFNILDLAVSEEYREIGTFKALGFTNNQVFFVYLIRGLVLGALGSVLGAFLGLWLGSILLGQYTGVAGITHALLEIDYVAMLTYTAVGLSLAGLCSFPSATSASKAKTYIAITHGRETSGQEISTHWSPRLSNMRIVPAGYAFRSFLRKKNRVIGIVTILVVSTMLYTTSITSTRTFKGNVDYFFEEEFWMDINVNLWNGTDINQILRTVGDVDGVSEGIPGLVGNVWSKGFSFGIMGIPPNGSKPSLLAGEWFEGNDSAAVPTEFVARAMNLHIGDNLTLTTLSNVQNNITVKIVGISRDLFANILWMPLQKAQELFGVSRITNVLVYVEDGYDPLLVGQKISEAVRSSSVCRSEMYQSFNELVIDPYVYVMEIAILLSSSFSILMISTIVMMNVNERRREFATLKAIGVTPRQIWSSVLTEILIVGVIGSCLGAILSVVFVVTMIEATSTLLFSVQFIVFPVENIAWSTALSIITTLLSGLIPALSASRTRTAEALQYE